VTATSPRPPTSEAPPPPRSQARLRTFDSLSNVSFRWFLASALGQMASLRVQNIVRGYLAYELTGSYAALGTVFLANSISGISLNFVGGVWADRIQRRKGLVQLGQLASALVGVILGALVWTDLLRFEHLLIAGLCTGGINALTMPARQSLLPDVVGMDGLTNAVALNAAGRNTIQMVAPAVGGVVLAAYGAAWLYFMMASTYLFAVAMLSQVTTTARTTARRPRATTSPLQDLVAGLRYMARDRRIAWVLAVNTLFGLLLMPYEFLLPGFVADILDSSSGGVLGVLLSVSATGSLLGALLVASLPPHRRGLLYLASILLMGIALFAFAWTTTVLATAATIFVLGIGRSGRMSFSNVLVQNYVEDEYRGRVLAVYHMQRSVASLGTFFVGILAAAIGIEQALAGLAVLVVGLAALLIAGGSPLRHLD
jgi:MFS family permease